MERFNTIRTWVIGAGGLLILAAWATQPKPWKEVVDDCLLAYPSYGSYPSLSTIVCIRKAANARGWVWNGWEWVDKK